MELLAAAGWPAVTARAIAERSGANPGLIHYHYGGLAQLHRAIARRAVSASIRPMVDQLVVGDDVWTAVTDAIEAGADPEAMRTLQRLTGELVIGSLRDEHTRRLVRDELRQARAHLSAWVTRCEPGWAPARVRGVVVVITALLDGLFLQQLVDDELDLLAAANGLAASLERDAPEARRRRRRAGSRR